ncbi:CaiB/BaiF CoA transferase family protein, partial [Ottowia sp.]|uniref:CaiB/BaiF CoA transferase family protein n=1 Tax=Ottowia sp. TaxID=1898956 RepID=UPI0039E2EB54
MTNRSGPLAGIKVVEIAGIGPGPLAAMFLADLGATVIRVDRKEPSGLGAPRPVQFDLGLRNRQSIRVDLKDPAALALVMELIGQADALIEGFRPGVMERLGLGPEACLAHNPRLVYGRVTGWGQDGPLSQVAGHDLNYISITGALHAMGRAGQAPTPPLNVLGDYAGGSLYLAFGLLAAILEARGSGQGQVVDAAMVDGVASIMTVTMSLHAAGMLGKERGTNLLDTGAPFYEVYECADG